MTEALSAPALLDGAWRRAGLSLGDEPFVENSNVLWLQAGPYFADLRVPYAPVEQGRSHLDGAQAFSGQSHYDPPRMTWRHDLDTMPRAVGHQDTAVLEQHGPLLVERGEGYTERWQREALATDPAGVAQRNDPRSGAPLARVVVVAHFAVVVWAGPLAGGAALARRRGTWSKVEEVGGYGDDDTGFLEAAEALATGGEMTAGWQKIS